MFSTEKFDGLFTHLELPIRWVLFELKTETTDALVELVIANAQLLGEIRKKDAIRESVAKSPNVAQSCQPARYTIAVLGLE
jgi:hypothetical protein